LNGNNNIPNITTEEFNRIIAGKINVSILEKIPDVDLNATDLRQLKPLTHEMIRSDKKSNFWKAVKATLAGETTVGIIGREVKNVVKRVIPFGEVIDATADRVGNLFKSKRTKNTIMEKENILTKILRYLRQPSTRTGLAVVVTLITGWFGFDLNPDIFLNSVIGIVTGLSGIYAGIRAVQEMFKDEDMPNVQP